MDEGYDREKLWVRGKEASGDTVGEEARRRKRKVRFMVGKVVGKRVEG